VQGAVEQATHLPGDVTMQAQCVGDRGVMRSTQKRALFRKRIRLNLIYQASSSAQAQLRQAGGELLFENYSRLGEQYLGVQINRANLARTEGAYKRAMDICTVNLQTNVTKIP
jgi:hypothetical protein